MKFIKELIPYIIITIVVVLIRLFIVSPVQVDGLSMYPNLKNNEYLLLNKFDKTYSRFDIVVLKHNKDKLVKRVIGLPGEKVYYKNNKLYINDEHVEEDFIDTETADFTLSQIGYNVIPEDYYFVVGDNRGDSKDSRIIGLVSKEKLEGTVTLSISRFKKIN